MRAVFARVRDAARILIRVRPQRSEQMTPEMNVAQIERWASALSGAAVTVIALKRLKEERSAGGAALVAAGGALISRSATGFCPVYAAAGINTAGDRHATREALAGSAGVRVVEAMTINRPALEL